MSFRINLIEASPVLKWTDRIESFLLCLLLSAMILLSCVQIFLRTFFSSGLLWADPVLRFLVIWCGFLGGVAATSRGKHIAIDLAAERLPGRYRKWLELFTTLFCVIAAAGLAWAAWLFWLGEFEYSTAGPLHLPTWSWNTIYPLTFALICLKYVVVAVIQFKDIFTSPAATTGKK